MAGDKKIFWFFVWCAGLVVVWAIGRSDTVAQAMLLFFAAGVVPGTDMVLSPNQVMLLMGGLLAVSLMLIFSREIGHMFRTKRPAHDAETLEAGSLVIPEPLIITITRSSHPIKRAMQKLTPSLLRALLALVAACIVITTQLVRFWRWLEPYIRQFDRWLELTLKRNERIAGFLAIFEGARPHKPSKQPAPPTKPEKSLGA